MHVITSSQSTNVINAPRLNSGCKKRAGVWWLNEWDNLYRPVIP